MLRDVAEGQNVVGWTGDSVKSRRRGPILFGLWLTVVLLAAAGTIHSSAKSAPMPPAEADAGPLAAGLAGAAGQTGGVQPAPEADLKFERISVEQGLSESSVHCTYQDSTGFLWFCTEDGLNKYDGHDFTVYQPGYQQNTITGNYVRSVCESPGGVLWIATMGGGLDRLNLETGRFSNYSSLTDIRPSSDWLTTLLCDHDGAIWIGHTAVGLDRFDPTTNQFTRYRHVEDEPRSLSSGEVHAIFRDREGVLWVGTDSGLDRGDPIGQRFIHYRHDPKDPHSLSHNSVRAIFEDREGVLWIGTDGGLDRFDRQEELFVHYQHDPQDPHSLSHSSVRAIFEDREGVLWIGTDDGLNTLDRQREQFARYQNDPSDPSSLSNNWIWSIYQDREGQVWFGTYGGGVNKYDLFSERFAHYRARPGDPNSLSNNHIWSIYEDREGILWIGTNGGGLDRFNRAEGTVTHYQHDPADTDSLGHNVVRAIQPDGGGGLWIGTDGGGLDRFDPETEQFTHYRYDPDDAHSLSYNTIRALYRDSRGLLWIGTHGGGVSRFDPGTERFVRYRPDFNQPGRLRGDSVWSITEDREGALWFGTAGAGLNKLDRNTGQFTWYEHDPSDVMLCLHKDRTGQLWIATYGNGLYRFDRQTETFSVYREEDGLASNAVYGILEDNGETLWISSNNGLSRFDPQTETFRNYDASDGLQSQEFSAGAYYRSPGGEMFFGGIGGFNAFYPERIREDNPYVPPVVLTSLTQGGEPLDVGLAASSLEAFTLNWPNNFFEFEFAALSFSRPEKNQHAYMLDGFDKDWVQAGTKRFGRYTNLPGGTYTLRIKGSNGEAVWNDEGTAVRVAVVPPFWQTWLFRVIVLVVLVAGAVGVYRQRVRSVEARSWELEEEVQERTQEIEQRRQVAEGLRDILAVINSNRPLDEVLDHIIAQASRMLGAGATVLHQIERTRKLVAIHASSGLPDALAGVKAIPFDASWADEAILSRQPYLIPDLGEMAAAEEGADDDPLVKQWLDVTGQYYRSFLAVPLIVEGQVDHCIAFYYTEPQAFSEEELGLAVALADQAALAIENARLHERAKELAVVEERQRLARDLHDAVSQTLFSASLIAETLPDLWRISPDEVGELLLKLRQLSRGALAEMRALLMELRPAALAEASLKELLRQIAQAAAGREGIPVSVTVDEPCDLPTDVRIALYRIAQEALNNVVKHAQASRVEVSLRCAPPLSPPQVGGRTTDLSLPMGTPLSPQQAGGKVAGQVRRVELVIRDDGIGFDPDSVAPERLGLGIMRERAGAVGAGFAIDSQPGRGTQIAVVWTADGGQCTEGGVL
jgi:signal transduction histidine kinase/ligand-binding sensor domain-containing protein